MCEDFDKMIELINVNYNFRKHNTHNVVYHIGQQSMLAVVYLHNCQLNDPVGMVVSNRECEEVLEQVAIVC